jgi:hypothetical protein
MIEMRVSLVYKNGLALRSIGDTKPLGLSAVSHECVEVGKDGVSHGGCLHAPLGLWRL